MAKLLPTLPPGEGFNMFLRLMYFLAGIARCLRFYDRDLMEVAQSAPCRAVAYRAAEHYFHKSRLSGIYGDMVLMFQCLFTMSPILQRQHNSMGFDWHTGNILTWFRVNTSMNVGRFYFSCEEHARVPDPLLLHKNLSHLNINDNKFSDTLEMLFRAYFGRHSVSGMLANTLFDPIMLCQLGDQNTLRVGNRLFRLEKRPFEGCIDLRKQSAVVLSYRIYRNEWKETVSISRVEQQPSGKKHRLKTKTVPRRKLDISIDEQHITDFKQFVKMVLKSGLSVKYKIAVLDRRVGAFMYSVRHARDGFDQVVNLKRWLRHRLEPLCAQADQKAKKRPDKLYALIHHLPDIMVTKFTNQADYKRYYRRPNFFYDPHAHDETTFIGFFSPYREGK